MIDREHGGPISRQAEGARRPSRSAVYYKPRPASARICGPCAASTNSITSTRLRAAGFCCTFLNQERRPIGRRHVASLMKRIGIAAIYRRPNTSKPAPMPQDLPYLLRRLKIERADQVWRDGHHLHPNGARLRLPGGGRRRDQPAGSRASGVDHDGSRLLHRSAGGGPVWCMAMTGRLQQRPGQPVHQRRLYRRAAEALGVAMSMDAWALGETACSS